MSFKLLFESVTNRKSSNAVVIMNRNEYKNYSFEVLGVEERRISRIKVVVHPGK